MSTALALPNTIADTNHHSLTVGHAHWVCVQPGCDLIHHVWCGCGH